MRVPQSLRETAGFTLAELVIVSGIMVILSGIFIAYSGSMRYQIAVSTETAKIAQTIARAKSYALSTYNNTPQPCGYGVTFDFGTNPPTYVLFGYVDSANQCQTIAGIVDTWGTDPGMQAVSAQEVEAVLPRSLSLDSAPNDAIREVLFVAPDPRVYIVNTDGDLIPNGVVYLRSADGAFVHDVSVSAGGQIDF